MPTDKKEYKILLIEDNPGDFTLVEELLLEQIETLDLTWVKNYKETKKILEQQHNFDVILLDLSLPDKTGLSLINGIVSLSLHIPIIVLTGYEDLNFGAKSLSLGISDYILKDDLTSLILYKSIIYSSERKRSVFEQEESEKRYSDLFHLSPQPMWVYTIDTLRFEDVNEAAIKNYGYTREEFMAMTIKDIRPSEDFQLIEDTITNVLHYEDYTLNHVHRHLKKNGEIIYAEVRGNTIDYKGNKAKIILANDVTERIHYIQAIERQNKKLKDIGWIHSHLLRAPLARIMGLIDLFKNSKNNPEEYDQILEYVLISANELDEIIKDISCKTYAEERDHIITFGAQKYSTFVPKEV
nr:PAS domain S-box protein [uncultured Pedobacter sp.]